MHNWLVIWPRAQLVIASFKPLSAVIYELLDRPTIANIATTIEIAPFRIADFKLLPDRVTSFAGINTSFSAKYDVRSCRQELFDDHVGMF